jgi:hypothetical protein
MLSGQLFRSSGVCRHGTRRINLLVLAKTNIIDIILTTRTSGMQNSRVTNAKRTRRSEVEVAEDEIATAGLGITALSSGFRYIIIISLSHIRRNGKGSAHFLQVTSLRVVV